MLNKIFRTILLIVSTLDLFSEDLVYPEEFEFEGILKTWVWANTQNSLALLIEKSNTQELIILGTDPLQIFTHVQVPDSVRIGRMEWEVDDSGLLLITWNYRHGANTLEFFDIADLSFEQNHDISMIHCTYDSISSVAYDPVSRCWAALSTGEGHPDIAVSSDGEKILETGVYPGQISLIGWQDGKLIVSSSQPLHHGLSLSSYSHDSITWYDYSNSNESRIFSIDVEKGKAELMDDIFIPDITNSSKLGGLYYFQSEYNEITNKTKILMW